MQLHKAMWVNVEHGPVEAFVTVQFQTTRIVSNENTWSMIAVQQVSETSLRLFKIIFLDNIIIELKWSVLIVYKITIHLE